MSEITFIEIETGPNPSYAVIWMHGLGADGSDFEPIVPALGLTESPAFRFVFPNAPSRPVTCNGGYVMPAWYDIISLAPESREIDESGLVESMDVIRQFIAREVERGIPAKHVFLAGFSQGGAVAYSTALTHPEPLAGVIALSTYIPSARLITRNLSAANRHLPIFVAHGLEDCVVSPALGEQAIKLVETYGYLPEWHTYPMEHEVCIEEIAAIGTWLRQQTARQEAPSSAGKAVLQHYSTASLRHQGWFGNP